MVPKPSDLLSNVIAAIHWIQANRIDTDGAHPSARRVALAAGLNASHADQILKRRQSTVERATIAKMARRWNVRISWMSSGEGPIEPFDESELPDPYPTRHDTLDWAARVGGYSKQAIAQVAKCRLAASEADPGGQYWLDCLNFAEKHGRLPERTPGPQLVRPDEWPGWQIAADSILENNGLSFYWEAVIGFGETPTTQPAPVPLDRTTLLPLLDRFLQDYPVGNRGELWDQWHVAAHSRHEVVRLKHPSIRRRKGPISHVPHKK